MSYKNFGVWQRVLPLLSALAMMLTVSSTATRAETRVEQPAAAPQVQTISVEELKTKVERNEPVTIIDVRSTNSYVESANKIKGAIHVKLRRLQSRLSLPPLKTVPRDREIVTYCACPADEASIAAAHILLDAGFKRVRILKGGWNVWLKANGPVEPKPRA